MTGPLYYQCSISTYEPEFSNTNLHFGFIYDFYLQKAKNKMMHQKETQIHFLLKKNHRVIGRKG